MDECSKRVLPCIDNNRRNGRFWLLEAGKVDTKIFSLQVGALEFWTKETTKELIDVASILEQVDSDG